MVVVGVNGCPGGWLAAALHSSLRDLSYRVHSSFSDLLIHYSDASCIAIDIPIGLAENAPRLCDIEARRVLGVRRSSVFPAPDARLVETKDYMEASAQSRSLLAKGISRQAFAIYAKVAEVNRGMTRDLQDRVIEVHPEVSFWAMNGERPMLNHKSKLEGFDERHVLLSAHLPGVRIPDRKEARMLARPASPDDVLDATVATWTARRFVEGRSERLLPEPLTDGRGLRMEINY